MIDRTQCYLSVSREALAENARTICSYVNQKVIAVVKCDGYGAGLAAAVEAWSACGVESFAVSTPEEAFALCALGCTDVLLLAPVADVFLARALIEQGVTLTAASTCDAARYADAACGQRVCAHVAVDTGMGRFGVRWDDKTQLCAIYRQSGLTVTGIFSHFSASFEKNCRLTRRQFDRFVQSTRFLEDEGIHVGMRHIANSCAALRFPWTRLDAVRIGSALVGALPCPVPVELTRVGTLHAMVVARRRMHKGDTVGYASVCRLRRDTDVAVVAVGEWVGFGLQSRVDSFCPMSLLRGIHRTMRDYRAGLWVEWHGDRLRVLGSAGTQYTLVDASGTELQTGDFVTAPANLLFPHAQRRLESGVQWLCQPPR